MDHSKPGSAQPNATKAALATPAACEHSESNGSRESSGLSDALPDDPGTSLLDRALIVAVQGGDRRAVGTLYDRHAGYLLAIGARMLRSRAQAEDLLHDVFIEAWQRAGSYRPERASVKTWLAMRMRSRCLDLLKSSAYAKSESLTTESRPESATPDSPVPGVSQSLDASRAVAALDTLPKEQRLVMQMAYFSGLSSTEMASRLAIPVGTVKSRMRAALSRLRAGLGPAS